MDFVCSFVECGLVAARFFDYRYDRNNMGRRSRAQKIIDGIDENIQSEFQNIVVYDFREKEATRRFWTNLKKIIEVTGGEMLQYSVYYGPIQGALAISELVEGYGGDVSRFIIVKEFRP